MAWTEERVEELKKLWGEGHSASQIAARMGGVTRNAVIGKVHRLGLSGRAAPAKPKAVHAEEPREVKAEAAPKRPVRTVLRDLPPITDLGSDRLTVSTIGTDECKWPIGDPASEEFHFCGQSASGGKPYCAYHAQLAFQPSTARRDRRDRKVQALPPIRAVS